MSKKDYHLVKLHFHTPLHLSKGMAEGEESYEILHSDTLKAALIWATIQLFGEDVDPEEFGSSFRISSGFPFWKDELFFPKPMSPLPLRLKDVDEAVVAKKIKKIRFIGQEFFQHILKGNEFELREDFIVHGGRFVSQTLGTDGLVMSTHLQQRVTIPEAGSHRDPLPYYLDRVFFDENGGLFVLLELTKGSEKDKIVGAFKLLGDSGIGSDRSLGNGLFTPEFVDNFSLEVPDDADSLMALSLYCPEKEELEHTDLERSAYQLIKRGGYLSSGEDPEVRHLRKRSIHMFLEGSVFSSNQLNGKAVDLRPELPKGMPQIEHPVFRDGQAIFIPIKQYDLK